jgi:hypothetical protein
MSVKGARRSAQEGLDIIQEIIAATQRSHVPVAENTQVPAGLRDRIIDRATAETQAATRPLIQQLRAQMPALREAMQREVRSIEGANEAAASAVQDVSLRGLHGQARKQLAEELASREADIFASTPLLASEARQTFQEQKGELRTDIAEAKAQQASGIAEAIAAALGSTRTQLHSRAEAESTDALATLKENTKERGEGGTHRKQFNLALAEAKRLLEQYPAGVPQTEAQWRAFARTIAEGEGIDSLAAARAAAERVREILARSGSPFAQNVNAQAPAQSALDLITNPDTGIIERFGG